MGGEVVVKTGTDNYFGNGGKYGLGVVGGYHSRNLDNTAALAPYSESMEGTVIQLGMRFYALNLYLGTGILYNPFVINYNVGAATTKLNYTGYGARIETGIDLFLGKTVLVAPKIHYDFINTTKQNSSDSYKLNDLGLGIGLGLRF
jgi:outer membrane protein W